MGVVKRSITVHDATYQEITAEARRLDRTNTWLIDRMWEIARREIRGMVMVPDPDAIARRRQMAQAAPGMMPPGPPPPASPAPRVESHKPPPMVGPFVYRPLPKPVLDDPPGATGRAWPKFKDVTHQQANDYLANLCPKLVKDSSQHLTGLMLVAAELGINQSTVNLARFIGMSHGFTQHRAKRLREAKVWTDKKMHHAWADTTRDLFDRSADLMLDIKIAEGTFKED